MKSLKSIITLTLTLVIAGIVASSAPAQTPVASFGGNDLSMLTNHQDLVKYCLKQVEGVQANVYCGSAVDGDSGRFFNYTNTPKSLDDIMTSILRNEVWWLDVTSPTDTFTLSAQLYDNGNSGKASMLFQGASSGLPQQDGHGQWSLPENVEHVPIWLQPTVRITLTNCCFLSGAKLIARDVYGNPYPVFVGTDGNNSIYFPSAFAGNGVLVLSGYIPMPAQPGWCQWSQVAISLKDGSPVELTWVEAQIILQGSSDIAMFKNLTDLTTFVWEWNGQGTVPLIEATFTTLTSNLLLHTYTSAGQQAKSYSFENAATGIKKTFVVPDGATSISTGTNVFKGVYYITSNGINLLPNGGVVVGGGGGGKGDVLTP